MDHFIAFSPHRLFWCNVQFGRHHLVDSHNPVLGVQDGDKMRNGIKRQFPIFFGPDQLLLRLLALLLLPVSLQPGVEDGCDLVGNALE
jgi:hypothetical protein